MSLSPRVRADYLLLIKDATSRHCLSAFATEAGVNLVSGYSNIVNKACLEMPELISILEALPPDLVAVHVANFLDGATDNQGPNMLGSVGDLFSEDGN